MTQFEAWLRGPIDGVPGVLQPIAHALIQAREESRLLLQDLPADLLWAKPVDVASVGFHLQHITGVIDRLFTYARGEALSDAQRDTLGREGQADHAITVAALLDALDRQVDRALDQLRATDPRTLIDARTVGRQQLPSTVMGLLFHAAEHSQRHVGQLLVTAHVVKGQQG